MPERSLTPSKITAWLDCRRYLTLLHEVHNGQRQHSEHVFGEMAQMLLEKGLIHEGQVLDGYGEGTLPPTARWVLDKWAERVTVGAEDPTGLRFVAHVLPPVEWRCALMMLMAGPEAWLDDVVLDGERVVLARRLLAHHGLQPGAEAGGSAAEPPEAQTKERCR